jgi:hypothetical protein
MNEFKQFTKQQWCVFIAIAVGVIVFAFAILYSVSALLTSPQPQREQHTYAVMQQDDEGYYYAVPVLQDEAGKWQINEDLKTVVFLDENVRDSYVGIGEIVKISLNPYGEKPIVTTYND